MIDQKEKTAPTAIGAALVTAIDNRQSSTSSVNLVRAVVVSNIVAVLVFLLAWAGWIE